MVSLLEQGEEMHIARNAALILVGRRRRERARISSIARHAVPRASFWHPISMPLAPVEQHFAYGLGQSPFTFRARSVALAA
jgi:hypothetical protein